MVVDTINGSLNVTDNIDMKPEYMYTLHKTKREMNE